MPPRFDAVAVFFFGGREEEEILGTSPRMTVLNVALG